MSHVSLRKEPSHEKEKIITETEASTDNVANKELKTNNALTDQTTDADAAAANSKVPEMNGAKTLTRTKTQILDFDLNLGPTTNQEPNEAAGGLYKGINKSRKLMKNWLVVILLVLVLWLYVRNAFRSSLEVSKLQEP